MGVYLPYMVVDLNAKATLSGQGEHETRRYTVGSGKDEETRYEADLYDVWRSFDLHIDDLTVESSAQRLDQDTKTNTNNIINSVMPFDTENAVVYDSNYLSGFTSERRDTNIDEIAPLVELQAEDIARHSARELIDFFDRGVRCWATLGFRLPTRVVVQLPRAEEKRERNVALRGCERSHR